MGQQLSHDLASGPGWQVREIICTCGPADRPFEEQHGSVCVAAVLGGTFQYRSGLGTAVLAPGAALLGNPGVCFQCGHEHGTGDRCIAFHFSAEYAEAAFGAATFNAPSLPASDRLVRLFAEIEASSRSRCDPAAYEEAGLRLLAAALASREPTSVTGAREERRVSDVVRLIETGAGDELRLSDLAAKAGMSAYGLLRAFRRVVGMTPYRYVLRTRLQNAAVRIGTTDLPIAGIAFEAGFGDLSTFNARFRRIMGVSPRAYRASLRRSPAAGSLLRVPAG